MLLIFASKRATFFTGKKIPKCTVCHRESVCLFGSMKEWDKNLKIPVKTLCFFLYYRFLCVLLKKTVHNIFSQFYFRFTIFFLLLM